jgi:hypothetical protein
MNAGACVPRTFWFTLPAANENQCRKQAENGGFTQCRGGAGGAPDAPGCPSRGFYQPNISI